MPDEDRTINSSSPVADTRTSRLVSEQIARSLTEGRVDPCRMRAQREFERRQRGLDRDLWRECCRGKRYEGCTLDGFAGTDPRIVEARDRVAAFTRDIRAQVASCRNVILFGSTGTGKDHLLAVMLRAACQCGLRCHWTTGPEIALAFRASFTDDETERGVLARLCNPDVLGISDPFLAGVEFTAYQTQMLYAVVDRRYSSNKPTWITCNAPDRQAMDRELGVTIVDRLRDGAMVIQCNWPSYRKAGR